MHNKPHPIGYIELQRAWVGEGDPRSMVASMMYDAEVEMVGQNPGMKLTNWRTESVVDGAGAVHYTLYVGFAPRRASSEPLDPRNLNNAEHAEQIGDPARDHNIGGKEQKF